MSHAPGGPSAISIEGEREREKNRERDRDRSDDSSCRSCAGTGIFIGDGIIHNSGSISSINNAATDCGVTYGYHDDLMKLDAFYGELSQLDFTSFEYEDDLISINPEIGPIFTLGSPELERYLTPAAHTEGSRTQVDGDIYFDSEFIPSAGCKVHDCCREAYDILGSLSFLNLSSAYSTSRSSTDSASTTASTANNVPLDHVLRLNRESSERLSRLLACSCARDPHLVLLYASIISRVLNWYQKASECTQRGSWSTEAVATDANPGPSRAARTSSASFTRVTSLAVAPTQMAMGSFDIHDQQVQTALRIQLLSGEIRKTGDLIDLFTSQGSSNVDEFTFSDVDSLYKSLGSWLRREYSKTADVMKSRLKEVST